MLSLLSVVLFVIAAYFETYVTPHFLGRELSSFYPNWYVTSTVAVTCNVPGWIGVGCDEALKLLRRW